MEEIFYQPEISKDKDFYVKYLSYFSMSELIPILEEKISSIKGEDYKVDYFITNMSNSNTAEVRYLAFPKKDEYVQSLISYKNLLIKYTKNNGTHDKIEYNNIKNNEFNNIDFKNLLDIKENDKVYLLAKEEIDTDKAFKYLINPPEDFYLNNNFFCYEQDVDQISNTIFEFAKKKLPKR